MSDDGIEIIESGGSDPVLTAVVNTGMNQASPAEIKAESWEGYYVDPYTSSKAQVLHDLLTGTGGVAGNLNYADGNLTRSAKYSVMDGPYSYLMPWCSELQWRTREHNSSYPSPKT